MNKQVLPITDAQFPVQVGHLTDEQKELFLQLNSLPAPEAILKSRFKGNSEYLPISHIEALLDKIFGPLNWKVSKPEFDMIGASTQKEGQAYVICTLEVSVVNTSFGDPIWITRGGTASGFVEHNLISTFAGKLKAEAFKNAAKSLGKVFGRDLNRKAQESITDTVALDSESLLQSCSTYMELLTTFNKLPKHAKNDPALKAAFTARKEELQK